MNWIDTHTHTYDPAPGQGSAAECVERALAAGVCKQIQGGVDLASIKPIWELCERYPGVVYPTIGLHPTEVKEDYAQVLEKIYAELASKNPSSPQQGRGRYVAVGEIGMDLYWDKTFVREQEEALRLQLGWAKEFRIPVVLHVRNAFEECWHILKQAQDGSLRGVFHCYSGSLEQARRVLELGFHFGIGGVLTFKNAKLPEIVKYVPLDSLVLETDSPYLAPVPYRGKPNESAYVPLVGEKLAGCLGLSLQQVAEATTANAKALFGL